MSSQLNEGSDEVLERLYRGAMTAAREGRLHEAADMLDQMMALDPNFPDAWWNLGTFRAQLNQHAQALSVWDIYRRMVPDDWRARVKVIQSCQALGDTARRDRERDELLALRQAGTDPELAAEPRYCREQFRVGDLAVFAYEIFEPASGMSMFYDFVVGQPDGPVRGHFSLGSYDDTTLVLREQEKIGPQERIYHVDWFHPGGHVTYGFFPRLLSYDETRGHVIAAISDTLPPLSSITISPETGRADIYLSQDDPDTTATCMAHELGVLATCGGTSPSPPFQPRSPAPPHATPPATGAVAGRQQGPPLADPLAPGATRGAGDASSEHGRQAGPWTRLPSWAARLLGKRDDRAN